MKYGQVVIDIVLDPAYSSPTDSDSSTSQSSLEGHARLTPQSPPHPSRESCSSCKDCEQQVNESKQQLEILKQQFADRQQVFFDKKSELKRLQGIKEELLLHRDNEATSGSVRNNPVSKYNNVLSWDTGFTSTSNTPSITSYTPSVSRFTPSISSSSSNIPALPGSTGKFCDPWKDNKKREYNDKNENSDIGWYISEKPENVGYRSDLGTSIRTAHFNFKNPDTFVKSAASKGRSHIEQKQTHFDHSKYRSSPGRRQPTFIESLEDSSSYQVFLGNARPYISLVTLKAFLERDFGRVENILRPKPQNSFAFAHFAEKDAYYKAVETGTILVQGIYISINKCIKPKKTPIFERMRYPT